MPYTVLTYFLLSILFLLSCAAKTTGPDTEEISMAFRSTGQQEYFMNCHVFADNSFRGKIYNSDQEGCIYLEINNSPSALFKTSDLFIQIYPFTQEDTELQFGPSALIHTFKKSDSTSPLMQSFIIDSHIIKVELQLPVDSFFENHKFSICKLDEQWEALQLVIYERRDNQDPIPIRTSQMLIPPFLVHPEYFKEQRGQLLAPYHPFFNLISQYQSDPQAYYDRAEEMCEEF